MNRCGCRGHLGLKTSYPSFEDARVAGDAAVDRTFLRENQNGHVAPRIELWVYLCPRATGWHLTRLTPEEQVEKERKRKQTWEDLKEGPELPYTELSKLMWDATLLADRARGSEALSRADVIELLFHHRLGWQASAPVKPTGKRDRWVREVDTTAEGAVTKLIDKLTRMAESPSPSS